MTAFTVSPARCVTAFLVLSSVLAKAQNTSPSQPQEDLLKAQSETLVVLGTAVPVPLAESSRSVEILPIEPNLLSVQTPLDLLRDDSSAFIEQRGAGGAQSDIVLRGGSFAQTLVLVNGFRINDAQTAHHNLDLPIPMEAMDSVQILEGAGSTLHGADALSGVVDFVTAAPAHSSVLLRVGQGSFGSNEEAVLAGLVRQRWSARVTGTRNFSTGFIPDRDYGNEHASVESWIGSRLGRNRSALRRQRPLLRSRPVLRQFSVLGADEKLVCLGAPGTRPGNQRDIWLSTA